MTAKEYVKKALTYKVDNKIKGFEHYSESQLNQINRPFQLNRRNSVNNYEESANELLNLIINYEVNFYCLWDFSFWDKVKEDSNYFFLAISSSTVLAIKKGTGEIVELEHEVDNSFEVDVAMNAEHFLDAAIIYLELYSYRLKGIYDRDDTIINQEYNQRCVKAAGGIKYTRFFDGLI